MEKKRIVYSIFIALIVTGTFLAIFFLGKNYFQSKFGGQSPAPKNEVSAEKQKIEKALGKAECNFASDGEAYKRSIEGNNPANCGCVKDKDTQKECYAAALNAIHYDQALKQYDASLCDQISDSAMKGACANIVTSSINDLGKSDPAYLAYIYNQNNNYDGAIVIFEKLLQEKPDDYQALLSLAMAYANKGLAEHKESELAPKAFDLVNKAIAINGKDPEAYRVQGFINEVKSEIPASLSSYNKALEIDSNYAPAYVGRGHANVLLGALDKALEDFKKAVGLDKEQKYVDVYNQLCVLESSRSDLREEAIKNCKVVTASPSGTNSMKANAYQILAKMYLEIGDASGAYAQLDLAKTYFPKDPNIYVSYAKVDISKQNFVSGEKNSRQAISLDQMKTAAYDALAYSLYKQQKYDEAVQAGLKALDLVDKDVSLLSADKPAEKKNICYVLANIYNAKGDKANETRYKQMGDDIK